MNGVDIAFLQFAEFHLANCLAECYFRPSECFFSAIMHKLNHESIAYTKRYLGITDDELQAVVQKLNL